MFVTDQFDYKLLKRKFHNTSYAKQSMNIQMTINGGNDVGKEELLHCYGY